MAYHDTVFAQLLKLVPRHEFESLAKEHHVGRRLRRTSRWSQFVMLVMGPRKGARFIYREKGPTKRGQVGPGSFICVKN